MRIQDLLMGGGGPGPRWGNKYGGSILLSNLTVIVKIHLQIFCRHYKNEHLRLDIVDESKCLYRLTISRRIRRHYHEVEDLIKLYL